MKILTKYLRFIFLISTLTCLFGVNSYAQTTYDWIGANRTLMNGINGWHWTNVKNWQSTTGGVVTSPATTYPGQSGSTDIVNIGVNIGATGKQPTLDVGFSLTIASLTLGDNLVAASSSSSPVQNNINLTINGTLTITGAFTQMHSAVGIAGSGLTHNYNSATDPIPYTRPIFNYLAGTGTMTCGSFVMGDTTVPTASNVINVTGLKMGATAAGVTLVVNITGNFILNCPASLSGTTIVSESLPEFSFSAGTINLYGQLILKDVPTYTLPFTPTAQQYSPLTFFSMDLFATNADNPTLNLLYSGSNAIVIQSGARNNVDFYNLNGITTSPGSTNVNYAGTGATQEVYTYSATGMNQYIDLHTGTAANLNMVYNNVTFSGTGTQKVDAGTFSVGGINNSGGTLVGGNVTLSPGTEIVDISSNNPTVTIGGNYTSGAGSTLLKNASSTSALTITGTTSNGGTFTHSSGSAVTFNGAFTNTSTGTYNQTGSGPVTSNSTTSNAGVYNQSGTGLTTFTGAVTNTGTIKQTNTGNILFSSTFSNSGSASVFAQSGTGTSTFTGAATNDGKITQTGILAFNNTFNNTLSGSTFTMTNGTATFINSYTNNGTFTQSGGTVNFNQPTTQSLTDNSTGGTTFSNVFMKNGGTQTMSGSGQFYISDLGILNVTNATTLQTGGILTINSDVNGTGTVAALLSGANITGNATVQRFIPGGNASQRGYMLLSPSVYVATDASNNNIYSINYLLNSTYISGVNFPATSLSTPTSKAGNPSLYLYRENQVPQYTTFLNSNYRGIADISTPPYYQISLDGGPYDIPAGNGFLFFFRGGIGTVNAFSTGSTPISATLASVGTLNQGPVSVTNWYNESLNNSGLLYTTVSGDLTIEGLNLVGNPYASTIDWNTWGTNTGAGIYGPGLSGFVYELVPPGQPGASNYASYLPATGGTNGGTNLIASGQGFFVQNTVNNSPLTFSENAKVNTQISGSALFLANKQALAAVKPLQQVRLLMQLDSINSDEVLISFNAGTKAGYNIMEDARYHAGSGKVSLATLSSDNVPLAINQLPLAAKGDTINLKVSATASGTYSLKLKSVIGVPTVYDIWLKDALLKDSVNLRTTATYSFTINNTDSTTFGANRFSLVMVQDPALAYKLLSFDAEKTGQGRQVQLTWKTVNEQTSTGFAIQRSNDNGKTYNVVGDMTSNGSGSYSFTDKNALTGNNLYRLQQVDLTNTTTYSNVVTVEFANNGNNIAGRLNCYPNPAVNTLNLSFVPKVQGSTTYDIRITNSTGITVKFAQVTDTSWQDNISNLLTGTYLIQVTDKRDNSVVGQTKFVKL